MVIDKIRPYMMPVAMLAGAVFYTFFSRFSYLTPYLIFVMLLLTYFNISIKNLRLSKLHGWLLLIQIAGSISLFLILKPFNIIVAQAAMICVLAPTATSAPVITRMLKGNVESLTTYSLLCNTAVAFCAPVIFSYTGTYQGLPFIDSFLIIGKQIFLLLILPFILALVIRKILPVVKRKTHIFSVISFFLWSIALTLVTAKIVHFILAQSAENYRSEVYVAITSLIICLTQFLTGRRIGRMYDNTIAGGQGLGQKNTVLAIWMAQTYLNPISSLGPGTYVLWQNIVNSYQIWRKRKDLA
ncbi:transporter [Paludibacteraceae bacterium OttesenSCG-928-F17]|nr:transporter [Paludibacteraceae bacterium OttesenSCG-928-F17]